MAKKPFLCVFCRPRLTFVFQFFLGFHLIAKLKLNFYQSPLNRKHDQPTIFFWFACLSNFLFNFFSSYITYYYHWSRDIFHKLCLFHYFFSFYFDRILVYHQTRLRREIPQTNDRWNWEGIALLFFLNNWYVHAAKIKKKQII